jgi:hypothetical protein
MTQPDPWKGFRGLMAGTLVLELITLLLAIPVIAKFGGGLGGGSGAYVAALSALLFCGAGLQRRSWALYYNLALQLGLIAGWFIHPAIGVLGLLFGLVWLYFLYIRGDVARRQAAGLLPSQRQS